jgi:nucleoside-diphosphate-sugar epimerase
MRVAITGASGFLGSYVLRNLQERDIDIVDVRRSPAPCQPSHPRTTVVQASLADAFGAFEAMGRPDLLIHLAWGGLPAYQNVRHVDEELPAQRAFLDACVRDGLRRLAVAGTCFEYGLQDGELAEDAALHPATQYGIAKQQLHETLASLVSCGLVDLDWARFFYLFGPGQAPGSLYSQLMSAIEEGRDVFDMSGGEQLRDFLPVNEAARLFVDLALAPGGAGPVNICSGKPVSVATLVDRWVAEHGARITLNKGYFPYSSYEPMAFWGSRTKLDAIIGTP